MLHIRRVPNTHFHKLTVCLDQLCKYYYGDAPEVKYEGKLDLTFTYVPAHVYYVMFELLKNSMRATAEHHPDDLPPVTVVFAEGQKDVCVKV